MAATGQSAEPPVKTKSDIVRHEPRTGMPFPLSSSKEQYMDVGVVYRKPKPSKDEKLKDIPRHNNYLFEIPPCTSDKTTTREVAHYSLQTANYDLTFYDPSDRRQKKRAEQISGRRVVAYRGGRLLDYEKRMEDPMQFLAMALNVSCLPTRFVIVTKDNRRYLEFREGEHAWSK